MSPRATPAAAAAASDALVSWRSGSSAQAFAVGISGSVEAPFTHSGEVRWVRKYVWSGVASLPRASRRSSSTTTRYEVSCFSGCVQMTAAVLPVVSLGVAATTNSVGCCSSRTTCVTAPPGPVRRTSNTRTALDSVAGLNGTEVWNVVGATVEKPSCALTATCGSPKFAGFVTGMLTVRSRVPANTRLIGDGRMRLVGSNRAAMTPVTGVPSSLRATSVSTARGLLLLELHAASNSDDNARASGNRACMAGDPLADLKGGMPGYHRKLKHAFATTIERIFKQLGRAAAQQTRVRGPREPRWGAARRRTLSSS